MNAKIILKKKFVLILMLLVCQCCFAIEDTNILAAGDWSKPVDGSHGDTLRGRLLFCESPKNHSPAVYLELQDCGQGWGNDMEVYCNMNPGGGCHLNFSDTSGQPIRLKGGGFGGGMSGKSWITLPADTTVRLRISAYATFSYASTNDYLMSGTFTVDPPADHLGDNVFLGTLNLPPVKIPAKSATTSDPIDRLEAKLSDSFGLWQNGLFPRLDLPETALPEQVIKKNLEMTIPGFNKGDQTNYTILEIRHNRVGLPYAALVQTDFGEKIVVFNYDGPKVGWWSRNYDANQTN